MNSAEQFVWDTVDENGGMDEVDQSVELIEEYMIQCYYYSKNQRLWKWMNTNPDIFELVIAIFTAVLVNQTITYQAICGLLNHKIRLEDTVDRIKIIAETVALISQTGLINIHRPGAGKTITITTDFSLDEEIPIPDKHKICIHRPQPISKNRDRELGSMLLGHKMNHHEEHICLDHLNRMNQIPLTLNKTFLTAFTEEPKQTPITADQKDQWNKFVADSMAKYQEVLSTGNKMYSIHKFDSRGRSYSCGYHITTHGSSFKKATVELYNTELVET